MIYKTYDITPPIYTTKLVRGSSSKRREWISQDPVHCLITAYRSTEELTTYIYYIAIQQETFDCCLRESPTTAAYVTYRIRISPTQGMLPKQGVSSDVLICEQSSPYRGCVVQNRKFTCMQASMSRHFRIVTGTVGTFIPLCSIKPVAPFLPLGTFSVSRIV